MWRIKTQQILSLTEVCKILWDVSCFTPHIAHMIELGLWVWSMNSEQWQNLVSWLSKNFALLILWSVTENRKIKYTFLHPVYSGWPNSYFHMFIADARVVSWRIQQNYDYQHQDIARPWSVLVLVKLSKTSKTLNFSGLWFHSPVKIC